jgi:uncharacterized membrane protein
MDWFSIIKLLHVTSAIIWLGGGFLLVLLAIRADRAGDTPELIGILRTVAQMGNLVFVPASLATLIFGLIMTWFWVGFAELWIVIGLAGYASTFLMGTLVLKPSADRMLAIVDREGATPAALLYGRRILRAGKFDYVVMFVILIDMVMKPAMQDQAVLAAMAAILAVGAALVFGAPGRTRAAEA